MRVNNESRDSATAAVRDPCVFISDVLAKCSVEGGTSGEL